MKRIKLTVKTENSTAQWCRTRHHILWHIHYIFLLFWKYVFKIIQSECSRPKWDEGSLTRGQKAHFLTLFSVLKSFIILHSNATKPFAMFSQNQAMPKCLFPYQNMHFWESAHHVLPYSWSSVLQESFQSLLSLPQSGGCHLKWFWARECGRLNPFFTHTCRSRRIILRDSLRKCVSPNQM